MNPSIFYRVINNSIFRVDKTGVNCSIVLLLNIGAWSYYSTWEFLKLCDEHIKLGDFLTFDEARAALSMELQGDTDEAAALFTMLTDAEDYKQVQDDQKWLNADVEVDILTGKKVDALNQIFEIANDSNSNPHELLAKISQIAEDAVKKTEGEE